MFIAAVTHRFSYIARALWAGRRCRLARPVPQRLTVEECEARLLPNSLLAMSGLADLPTGTAVADAAPVREAPPTPLPDADTDASAPRNAEQLAVNDAVHATSGGVATTPTSDHAEDADPQATPFEAWLSPKLLKRLFSSEDKLADPLKADDADADTGGGASLMPASGGSGGSCPTF
jgi:hypothetical protein